KLESFRAVCPDGGSIGLDPSNSPRTGNLTGNFSGFGPFWRFSCPIDQINQRLVPQFPEPGGTGNFFAGNREFLRQNREFIRRNRESSKIGFACWNRPERGGRLDALRAGPRGRPSWVQCPF